MGKPVLPVMVMIMISVFLGIVINDYNQWTLKNHPTGKGLETIDCSKNSTVTFGTVNYQNPKCEGAGLPFWYNLIWAVPLFVAFVYAMIPLVG